MRRFQPLEGFEHAVVFAVLDDRRVQLVVQARMLFQFALKALHFLFDPFFFQSHCSPFVLCCSRRLPASSASFEAEEAGGLRNGAPRQGRCAARRLIYYYVTLSASYSSARRAVSATQSFSCTMFFGTKPPA